MGLFWANSGWNLAGGSDAGRPHHCQGEYQNGAFIQATCLESQLLFLDRTPLFCDNLDWRAECTHTCLHHLVLTRAAASRPTQAGREVGRPPSIGPCTRFYFSIPSSLGHVGEAPSGDQRRTRNRIEIKPHRDQERGQTRVGNTVSGRPVETTPAKVAPRHRNTRREKRT
jgi:hypothetical protein